MSLVPFQPKPMAAPAMAYRTGIPSPAFSTQPDSRAGTIYERAERRRPHDRRQYDTMVYLDTRASRSERRRDQRRSRYDSGRRQWPEPPPGIDVWV